MQRATELQILATSYCGIGFFLVAAALLDGLGPLSGGYDKQRLALVFVCMFFAPWAVLYYWRDYILAILGWGIFVLAIGISFFYRDVQAWGVVEGLFYPLYLLAVAGLGGLVSRISTEGIAAALSYLVISAVAYSLVTLMVYCFALWDQVTRLDEYLPWGFANIRFWSHVATWLVPLFGVTLEVGPFRRSSLWKILVMFSAGIFWWLIFVSSARGSFISLVAAAIIAFSFLKKDAFLYYKRLAYQLFLGVGFWLVLSVILPSLLSEGVEMRGVDSDSSGRMRLWYEAWIMSLQHFPLGMGPQSWLTHDLITDGYRSGSEIASPHNMYLLWAAEYGWLGVLGLALIGVQFLKRVTEVSRRRSGDARQHTLLQGAVLMSVLAALIHAGVSGVLIAPASMLVGLFVLATFWGLFHHKADEVRDCLRGREGGKVAKSIFVSCVFAVSAIWLWQVCEYHKAMERDIDSAATSQDVGLSPRFWLHGYYPRRNELMSDSK